jgi:hypothetical protein
MPSNIVFVDGEYRFVEPTFTLRAQDSFAADLVERWANLAEASRCPPGKVLAARAVARAMFEWRTKKLPD